MSSTNTVKYARGSNDYYYINGSSVPMGIPVNRSTTTLYYFEGIITVKAGVVFTPPARSDSAEYAVPMYIQDDSGGVILFNFVEYWSQQQPYDYQNSNYGDKVAITGSVAYDDYYIGATQIKWAAVLISSPNALPAPTVIKCSDLKDSTNGNDNGEKYEGFLVRLNNVTIVDGKGSGSWPSPVTSTGWTPGSGWRPAVPPHGQWNSIENNLVTDETSQKITMRFERGCGIGGFSTRPTGKFDLIGVVSQYDDPPFLAGYQVMPRSSADLVYIPENVKAKVDASGGVTISWDSSNDPDLDGYNVYRAEKPDLSDGVTIAYLLKSTSIYDIPEPGKTYYYAVKLQQTTGPNTLGFSTYIQKEQLESSFSNTVTNNPDASASSGSKPEVYISAKVFNPYQNSRLRITYNGRPDSRFTVRVIDTKGRVVKIAAQDVLWDFSVSGRTIDWQGDYQDGNKAPVGLYIIQVEENRSDGSSAHTEKVAAVGVRMR